MTTSHQPGDQQPTDPPTAQSVDEAVDQAVDPGVDQQDEEFLDQEFEAQEWVFLGLNAKGKPSWRDQDGSVYTLPSFRARVVGGIHVISTSPTQVRGSATWTGRHAEDAAAIQVEAIRRERQLRQGQLERNTSRMAHIDTAIGDLLELAQPLLYDQRQVLADYVTSKIFAVRRASK